MARQAWLGGRQTQNPERGRKPISGTATLREDTPSRQTQNPERGRKHIPRVTAGAHHSSSRQTQNPERGRKLHHASCHQSASSSSSDPKPREGTETLGIPCADSGFACRQTQNPERGRKRVKPPPASPGPPRSSDPKPREGTETGQRSTPALVDFRVVRPKTPRGDGNMGYLLPARGDAVRGRQTQNPERGRKLRRPSLPFPLPTCRQTQNPERGRKLAPTLSV
ncbi:Uncharacterised protein [Mycobacterium tuberculosis]|nr:Uncharacterised protein [Mycobacterium tuberculosis]